MARVTALCVLILSGFSLKMSVHNRKLVVSGQRWPSPAERFACKSLGGFSRFAAADPSAAAVEAVAAAAHFYPLSLARERVALWVKATSSTSHLMFFGSVQYR
jgi:hypothetical protein